jgi:phosphate transport system substrate-binding protein
MRADRLRRLRSAAALAVTAVLGLLTFGPAQAAQATTYVPITGSGSTYAYPALYQWASDLVNRGLHINYYPVGSAAGRSQYSQGLRDYAGSDIAFLTSADPDPFGGTDGNTDFAYSYIPDVAGGLSFLYNLQVGGQKITNMRLSGQTLAEIFTGHITNWDDPAITHDYGRQLPSIPITVVTRSDGAGESYFLTNWMDKVYHNLWVQFCVAQGGPPGCGTGPTELFPGQSAGFKSLSGSDTLSAYIQASSNNGAIGYAEYAYAKEYHLPVVNMLNAAGYYVPPSASNVAIALEKAVIDEIPSHVTFLMQKLDNVYTDPDPRAYPLSSYSYLIVPRDSRTIGGTTYHPKPFSNAKGATLSTYINYILCGAQQFATNLGYSPLPQQMVVGGFLQEGHIPGALVSPAAHHYSGCNNPAYLNGVDVLTATAPYPTVCQKVTAQLNCVVGKNGQAIQTSPGGSGGGGPGSGGPGSGPGGKNSAGTNGTTGPGGTQINPNTGQLVSGSGPAAANVYAQPVGLASRPAEQWLFGVLTALVLIAVVAVPVLLGTWLQAGERNGARPRGSGPGGPARPAPSGGER